MLPLLGMNKSLVSELPLFIRAFCAQSAKRITSRPEYMTPQQILKDPAVQAMLHKSDLSSSTPINDPKTKLSILQHLSQICNVPVTSNAFLKMSTADNIAEWYSNQLKPCKARPHARSLIRHTLADGEQSKQIDDRIDLERDAVQKELESRIPDNVILDERTFLKVDDNWVRHRHLPKPQLGRR